MCCPAVLAHVKSSTPPGIASALLAVHPSRQVQLELSRALSEARFTAANASPATLFLTMLTAFYLPGRTCWLLSLRAGR